MAGRGQIGGVGLVAAVAGGFLIYAGFKDFGVLEGLRSVAGGQPPAARTAAHTSGMVDLGPQLDAILAGGTSTPAGTGAGGSSVASTGSAIADDALRYLGTKYVYGGVSPAGFDCSGLIYYVLRELGYMSVPRTIGAQNLWPGAVTVGVSQAAAGDLVLWPYGAGPNAHGGIVVGPGQYVNAPYTGTVVRVDPIPASLHGGPPVYRRVLAQSTPGTVLA